MLKQIFLTAFLAVSISNFAAQTPVPMDKAIRYGKLENGLTFYIRHNEQPKGFAEFHIAQNVGAILEDDHQDGLAHFLEHMAFNGSKNFPGKGIINYFETLGVRFGADINAYTSLDETVYRLSNVPTSRQTVVDSALLVLHDWSCAISLLDDEIEAERKVILEEWRTSSDYGRRIWAKLNPKKYPNSQYAKRDIIGDTAVIRNFSHQALRDYYHRWYRPDEQAVIIVGDVDVEKVENEIRRLWAEVPSATNRGERPIYEIPDNAEPIVAVVTDPEAQQTQIVLEFKHAPAPDSIRQTEAEYALLVVQNLVSKMLGSFFAEQISKPENPFVAAYGDYSQLVKSKDAFRFIYVPKPGMEKATLAAAFRKAEEIRRFGFTASDLERAKTELLAGYKQAFSERANRKNRSLTDEYIRHFLHGESVPGIEWEYYFVEKLLPQISAPIVNAVAQKFITDENLIIAISAPEKVKENLPDSAEVLQIFQEIKNSQIQKPKENFISKNLISKTPKPGKIIFSQKNEKLATEEFTLSNGAKIVIKPTAFKQNEILLNAFSHGGLAQEKISDLPSAMLASDVVEFSGAGNHSATDLKKILAGKVLSLEFSILDQAEQISGASSVEDFETLLQLLHLYLTEPREDKEAFKALKNMYHTSLKNRADNPKSVFSDSLRLISSQYHPRTVLLDTAILEKVNHKKALKIFTRRFAAPDDFTFTFTGNIDAQNPIFQNLICTWIGSLKPSKRKEKPLDIGTRAPKGEKKVVFLQPMQTPNATCRVQFTANLPFTLDNRLNAEILERILKIRYFETLRENEGGSYGVGVLGVAQKRVGDDRVLLVMQFDTDPEKQEKMVKIIYDEFEKIVENGPSADDLQKVKLAMEKEFEQQNVKNSWWSGVCLPEFYREGNDFSSDYLPKIQAVTAEENQNLAQKIAASGNVLQIVMLPKN